MTPLVHCCPAAVNAAGPKLPPSVESHGRCHSAGREKYNYLHSLSPRLSTPVTRASSATTRKQLRWERVAADERGGQWRELGEARWGELQGGRGAIYVIRVTWWVIGKAGDGNPLPH